MSLISSILRSAVVTRAGGRCEYCHLPSRGQVATFPIDHVLSLASDGETAAENLALACPNCNGHKWKHTDGTDERTGNVVPLYNPRLQVWSDHFEWSMETIGLLIGRTPCGRATIARLRMNDTDVVATRQLLAELGLFPELRTNDAGRT